MTSANSGILRKRSVNTPFFKTILSALKVVTLEIGTDRGDIERSIDFSCVYIIHIQIVEYLLLVQTVIAVIVSTSNEQSYIATIYVCYKCMLCVVQYSNTLRARP